LEALFGKVRDSVESKNGRKDYWNSIRQELTQKWNTLFRAGARSEGQRWFVKARWLSLLRFGKDIILFGSAKVFKKREVGLIVGTPRSDGGPSGG